MMLWQKAWRILALIIVFFVMLEHGFSFGVLAERRSRNFIFGE